MKNYLYYFKFFSGEYSQQFFQQINAESERDAIIEIVSFFKEKDEDEIKNYLDEELGKQWSIEDFWNKIDTRFHPDDYYVGYTLIDVKEINFDLRTV